MDIVTINRATVEQALEALVVYSIKAEHKRTHADNCQAEEVITALRQALEQPAQQQEPVAWIDLLKKADAIVRDKTVWKRFIDGTPLANDIAVWMADFAQQHSPPPVIDKSAAVRIATALGWEPKREWVGLTEEDVDELQSGLSASHADVRAIEAKLKEKNT